MCAASILDVLTPPEAPKRKQAGILLCFSLVSNGKRLFGTKKSAESIDCINGIRFLSISWVVLGHTFFAAAKTQKDNVFKYGDVRFK